jgi:hypothetical protein
MVLVCHIVGLNNLIKPNFIRYIDTINKSQDIIIKDLDQIAKNLFGDQELNKLNEKLNKATQKEKQGIQNSIHTKWKILFAQKTANIIKLYSNKYLIFIGLSTYYKNLKININIPTKVKLFVNINPGTNAKQIVRYNLQKYLNFVINGTFPLEYLDHKFIKKQRELLKNTYVNYGYTERSFDSIKKIINMFVVKTNEQDVYFASNVRYDNVINKNTSKLLELRKIMNTSTNDKLTAYSDKWLALVTCINTKNKIAKGFSEKGTDKVPYIKELVSGAFDDLHTHCYLYSINNSEFNRSGYKYTTEKLVNIRQREYIADILDELVKLNVILIKKV